MEEILSSANLDSLPGDVIQVLMASLSLEDVRRLCSTSQRLRDLCRRRDFIELKVREKVLKEAPLGSLVNTYTSYDKLIGRGFKTVYHLNIETLDVQFGAHEANPVFSIVGLPPPKGTRVWVFGSKEYEEFLSCLTFSSFEELKAEFVRILTAQLKNRQYREDNLLNNFVMYELMSAPITPFESVMDAFNVLGEEVGFHHYFYVEVELP